MRLARILQVVLGCAVLLGVRGWADDPGDNVHVKMIPLDDRSEPGPKGTYRVTLLGNPEISLTLDRPYKAYVVQRDDVPQSKEVRSYVFIPEDEQSSISFTVGNDQVPLTDEKIRAMYKGTTLTKIEGKVNDVPVTFRHYTDPPHLCSTFMATLKDGKGQEHLMSMTMVADSAERLAAMEKALSTIEFH